MTRWYVQWIILSLLYQTRQFTIQLPKENIKIMWITKKNNSFPVNINWYSISVIFLFIFHRKMSPDLFRFYQLFTLLLLAWSAFFCTFSPISQVRTGHQWREKASLSGSTVLDTENQRRFQSKDQSISSWTFIHFVYIANWLSEFLRQFLKNILPIP